ncbi:MAG: glycosyl transferase [Rhizobiales bacterium 62-47]|mgnify:CR=1 FL=1|nr:glycosyl transferase [Hyphomicrobiales bacterium]OJY11644.1 MAG: glycosyl transferase [Rhizobiales bacterium 62-47]
MLSVIIATDGVEAPVVATLAALVPGAAAGVVREVVLVDRGTSDTIAHVADVAGCDFLACEGSRGAMLAAGARRARSHWLMFLLAGSVLDANWIDEVAQFTQNAALDTTPRAGIFRYERSPYANGGAAAWLKHAARAISGPKPDQGLVILRSHYDKLGGHDVNASNAETRLLRKLGRARVMLRSRITMR